MDIPTPYAAEDGFIKSTEPDPKVAESIDNFNNNPCLQACLSTPECVSFVTRAETNTCDLFSKRSTHPNMEGIVGSYTSGLARRTAGPLPCTVYNIIVPKDGELNDTVGYGWAFGQFHTVS